MVRRSRPQGLSTQFSQNGLFVKIVGKQNITSSHNGLLKVPRRSWQLKAPSKSLKEYKEGMSRFAPASKGDLCQFCGLLQDPSGPSVRVSTHDPSVQPRHQLRCAGHFSDELLSLDLLVLLLRSPSHLTLDGISDHVSPGRRILS